MKELPYIMVAPNGAYKTKLDHPNLPVTIPETVLAVKQAYFSGADGAHVHIRNERQKQLLDVAVYRELIEEIYYQCPDIYLQITTESAGIYSSSFQRRLVLDLEHNYVSVAIKEITADNNQVAYQRFYQACHDKQITIQHILYHPNELDVFFDWIKKGVIKSTYHQLLFVLGRYTSKKNSSPQDLTPFLGKLKCYQRDELIKSTIDWGVCAFGKSETDCLAHAISQGGKARIGFENNLYNKDGTLAKNNAERVVELVTHIRWKQGEK